MRFKPSGGLAAAAAVLSAMLASGAQAATFEYVALQVVQYNGTAVQSIERDIPAFYTVGDKGSITTNYKVLTQVTEAKSQVEYDPATQSVSRVFQSFENLAAVEYVKKSIQNVVATGSFPLGGFVADGDPITTKDTYIGQKLTWTHVSTAIPEPMSAALLAAGLAMLAARRRPR